MVILCDKEWQHKQSISTFHYNSVPLSMVSIFFSISIIHTQPQSTLTIDIMSSYFPIAKNMSFLTVTITGLRILKVGQLPKLHLSKNTVHNLRLGDLQKAKTYS